MTNEIEYEKYGPRHRDVTQILADIHRLDREKALLLVKLTEGIDSASVKSVLNAAEAADLEEQVIRASEDCRKEVWSVVWDDSTKHEAWVVSWSAARAGMGAAAGHLIGVSGYDIEEHLALTADWYAVFDHAPTGEKNA
jgi:hypothetical protein